MIKEDKELLLKDLCARLPYGVKVNVKGVVYDNRSCRLTDIHHGLDTYIGVHDDMQYHIESIKPYLFPLSSMNEGQKIYLEDILIKLNLKALSDEIGSEAVASYEIDFYNKNHFDYRGLIEKGLAIDATVLNIYS